MAVTLQVSAVRAEIYQAAGGLQSAGTGATSTPLLGRIFHETFAELVGADERLNFHAALAEAEPTRDDWYAALLNHIYERLVGPKLRHNQAQLHSSPEQVLSFWEAGQELCKWLTQLLWQTQEKGAAINDAKGGATLNAEQPLRWELREPGWTDAVVLTGVADAVWCIPGADKWCVIELKTGQTAPESDLAQACLYHQMLAASGLRGSRIAS